MKEKRSIKKAAKKFFFNKHGDAIIFTLGILLILFVILTGMVVVFSLWQKSSFAALSGSKAGRIAQRGLKEALWELQHDTNWHDSLDEPWHTKFEGSDMDLDGDGITESRWFYIKDSLGKVTGRYAVLIKDESGKINLNAAGNISKNGFYSFNEGWSCAEISLLNHILGPVRSSLAVRFRFGADRAPGIFGIDDNNNAAEIANDGIDNDGDGLIDEPGEGIDEPSEFDWEKPKGDDRPYFTIEDIKMVPSFSTKIFQAIRRYITCTSYETDRDENGKLKITLNTASLERLKEYFLTQKYSESQALQIALNIIDFRDKDSIPTIAKTSTGEERIGIEKSPYLNEIEPTPKLKIETHTVAGGVLTVISELGPHYIELFNPYNHPIDISGWNIQGGFLTLPGSTSFESINNATKKILHDLSAGETSLKEDLLKQANLFWKTLSPSRIILPQGSIIGARSYFLIGDSIKWKLYILESPEGLLVIPFLIPIHQPGNADYYTPIVLMNIAGSQILAKWINAIINAFGLSFPLGSPMELHDAEGNLIERSNYGNGSPHNDLVRQKNDPRIFDDHGWFTGPPSPGKRNILMLPSIGGEFSLFNQFSAWPASFRIQNGPFSSPAGLSFIHKGEQWRTLDLWKGQDRKVIDQFTIRNNPSLPVAGRLNINTASETALVCLPLVDLPLARKIIETRPFTALSQITGTLHSPLNKEITRRGFNKKDDTKDGFIDTEEEKELVISKIANLITIRSNIFSITVIGQKVAEKSSNGTISQYQITAEKRVRVIYDRQARKIRERRSL